MTERGADKDRARSFERGIVLTVVAPAKVNLHLAVGSRRSDGYHDVTTVMHALELGDSVTVAPSDRLTLVCEPGVGVRDQANLAFRAASAMGAAFGARPDFEIVLRKRVPHGAGLGGGSSDAAAVIAAIAQMWSVDPRGPECVAVAASLGADVPFFLLPSGCALMVGRGDVLRTELVGLSEAPVAIVHPGASVATQAAYAAFDRSPVDAAAPDPLIDALARGDRMAVGAALYNNLAGAACTVVPAIDEVLRWIRSMSGVLGAQVSGSGSAVFALCEADGVARAVATGAAEKGWWGAASRLRTAGVRTLQAGGIG